MSRPLKIQKNIAGTQSSTSYGESAFEALNLAAAAVFLECRSALAESPAAARPALEKHWASITRELAQALERVGSYARNDATFAVTPLFLAPPYLSPLPMHATMNLSMVLLP